MNSLGQLSEGRLRTTVDNIAGKRLEKAKDRTEIGKAFEDAYKDLGYKTKIIYTDPSNAPQLIDEKGNIKGGTAYVGADGIHTIIINVEDPKNSTRSGIIGTISEEGSHIIGKVEGRQLQTGTEEKGLESTGRATNEYFTDKYKKNDIPIEAKSDGKDYSNVDFGENVGDDRGACSRGGNILLNCNKNIPAIKPTVANFRELDDKKIQAKNAITKLKDYCNKNGNVCRYSSEKKEYEFYDIKKLSEYEGYLKLSGLKDTVKIVNKRREYEYAKESQKYKIDRATANKEQIRLGEALARFNYPQIYQTYIFQGGEKNPEAFENSEGFKFRENKFISDLKNSGVEFGGKYELYDGNRYITSLKNYEDLAKFSGVASKNGIKLTMSEIYTSALLTQHDTRPLKIDIKGSAIVGEEVTAVAGAVMAKNQLDKMPVPRQTTIKVPEPKLKNKLQYIFGKATGSEHNMKRSQEMASSLSKIGINDTSFGRKVIEEHLIKAYKEGTTISTTIGEFNGKTYFSVTKESFLKGPTGGVKIHSIWRGNELITVIIKGSEKR